MLVIWVRKENRQLEKYLGKKLQLMANIRTNQEAHHDFESRPLNSAERAAVRAMKLAQDRGERISEYARCFNCITNECDQEVYIV